MDTYLIIKTLHILSSTVLFGTGLGIAFFMFVSRFSKDMNAKYYAVKNTVLADFIFTTPAVILQPVTGIWLLRNGGFEVNAFWLTATYALYALASLCWLPVVWIQIQLRHMLKTATEHHKELPTRYHRLFRLWFFLGWPAFLALIAVFFLMVAKPV